MLLAIDTATRTMSLALHDGEQLCAEMTWTTNARHTVELTPAIQHLLKQAQVSTVSLRALAVSQGPGSFNGLRIGLSTAKGLAMALGLPLIAIPTLDIVAASQPYFEGTLVAVVQAGRGRVCAERYLWQEGKWVGQHDTRIMGWDSLFESILEKTRISGEIDADARALRTTDRHHTRPIRFATAAFSLRRAGFLADLAWERLRSGETGDPAAIVPFYLHQPGVPHP